MHIFKKFKNWIAPESPVYPVKDKTYKVNYSEFEKPKYTVSFHTNELLNTFKYWEKKNERKN